MTQPKHKRRIELFGFYESAAIQRHLERMAAQGWRLCKLGNIFWTYEAMEPRQLRYSVVYFPGATAFDPGPSAQQQDLWELCRQDGWQLAAEKVQLQIFYNEKPEPYPIETEPQLQLENLHSAMKRSLLPSYGLLFVLGLLMIGQFLVRLSQDFVGTLSNNNLLLGLGGWVLVLLAVLLELGRYFLWRRRALKIAREEGRFAPMESRGWLQKGLLLTFGLLLLLWLWSSFRSGHGSLNLALAALGQMLLLMTGARGLLALLRRRGYEKGRSQLLYLGGCVLLSLLLTWGLVAWVLAGGISAPSTLTYEYGGHTFTAYQDELPLSLEAIGLAPEGVAYSRRLRVQDSLLLRLEEGNQRPYVVSPEAPSLSYAWVKPGLRALYEPSLRGWMQRWQQEGYSYTPLDPDPWGAQAAWQLSRAEIVPRHQYLLCYEASFIELTLRGDVGEEQLGRLAALLQEIA